MARAKHVMVCVASPDYTWIVAAYIDLAERDEHSREGSSGTGQHFAIWDGRTRTMKTISALATDIVRCAVSREGRFIVSGSLDGAVKVWETSSGSQLNSYQHDGPITACAISPDNAFVVSAAATGTVKVCDSGGEERTFRMHAGPVSTCIVGPDARFIVSGSLDGTLSAWDPASGRKMWKHTGCITSCAISPDGTYVISAEAEALTIWDARSGRERNRLSRWETFATIRASVPSALAISPDATWVVGVVPSRPTELIVWNVESKQERAILAGHRDEIKACTVSADGAFIQSAAFDGTVRVWRVETGTEAAMFPLRAEPVCLAPGWGDAFVAVVDVNGELHPFEFFQT